MIDSDSCTAIKLKKVYLSRNNFGNLTEQSSHLTELVQRKIKHFTEQKVENSYRKDITGLITPIEKPSIVHFCKISGDNRKSTLF